MTYKKSLKPKAANDNQHDQSMWELLHIYLEQWLTEYGIPRDQWPYNRSIHYTYELQNRPWLNKGVRTEEMIYWLFAEAKSLDIRTYEKNVKQHN